jgi:hypothetical protein
MQKPVDFITSLSHAFSLNGPFFFCIFLSVIWYWTIKKLIVIYQTKEGDGFLKYSLLLSSFIFLFSSIFVGWKAVGHWLNNAGIHPIYAKISLVPDDVSLDGHELYQNKISYKNTSNHTLNLVVLKKKPCDDKSKLSLFITTKGMDNPNEFDIECSFFKTETPDNANLEIGIDDEGDMVLIGKNQSKKEVGLFVSLAYAGEVTINSKSISQHRPYTSKEDALKDVEKLQDMYTILGQKLDILSRLSISDSVHKNMNFYYGELAITEPLYATILDLTRHTDKRVALKAKSLLDKLPILDDMIQLANSDNQKDLNALKINIESLSVNDLKNLENKIKSAGESAKLLSEKLIAFGAKDNSRVPIPSYYPEGDRFFVSASWDNKNKRTTECVGKAYAHHWGGTEDDQIKLAESRRSRVVFYNKNWAISMLESLGKCDGVQVKFINGNYKR